MTRSQLRDLVREEVKQAMSETLINEASRNPEIQDVDKFISDVLKMGTRANIFDAFMKREGIAPDELSMFVYAVAMRLKDKWT